MSNVASDLLALPRLGHGGKTVPARIALTQPMGAGDVLELT